MPKIISKHKLNIKSVFSIQNVLCFAALFVLYICRTPEDSFQAYLFAEDGSVLITDSIFEGIGSIFTPYHSTLWVMQRVLAFLCYGVCFPFGNIEYLPYIMAFAFKAFAVLGIMYFMSSRFEWIVPSRLLRFLICAGVIAAMPQNAYGLMPCDTSLPFVLIFAVFLIGLDLLCGKKDGTLSIPRTIFLVLMALSYAGCVFVLLVAAAVFLKWLIISLCGKTFSRARLMTELIKLGAIFAAVLIQLSQILSGDRISSELDLLRRLYYNTKSFIFLPGLQSLSGWRFFFLGLCVWILLIFLSGISRKIVFYSAVFSFLHMFYCSMTGTVDYFYSDGMAELSHYIGINVMIAALLIGIALSKIIKRPGPKALRRLVASGAVILFAVYSVFTYRVDVKGFGSPEIYKKYSVMYDIDGSDRLQIQVAPWELLACTVPANISDQPTAYDLSFELQWLNADRLSGEKDICLSESKDSADNIIGHMTGDSADILFDKCFIKLANGEYRAAYQMDVHTDEEGGAEHNSFSFYVEPEDFAVGIGGESELTIYALDTGGQWHVGSVDLNITITE